MDIVKKALKVAHKALNGKFDKAGHPLIDHAIRMAEKMGDAEEKAVAILHDVIEDGGLSGMDLRKAGFSADVALAVTVLSHKKGERSYMEYIGFVKAWGGMILKVKLADIEDHLDPKHAFAGEKYAGMMARYEKAKALLLS